MQQSHRLFICARCHRLSWVCQNCDRGQRYCSKHCSHDARKEQMRCAGITYQATEAGRQNHAARQQTYLVRKEKMTHQGSNSPARGLPPRTHPVPKIFHPAGFKEVINDRGPSVSAGSCDFCGCQCSGFTRRSPLRRPLKTSSRRRPRPPGHSRLNW